MDAIRSVQGRVAPLSRDDVDTDQIIPARYLTSVDREGYAEGLFRDLRDKDSSHFLNEDKFSGAKVMAVGNRFEERAFELCLESRLLIFFQVTALRMAFCL